MSEKPKTTGAESPPLTEKKSSAAAGSQSSRTKLRRNLVVGPPIEEHRSYVKKRAVLPPPLTFRFQRPSVQATREHFSSFRDIYVHKSESKHLHAPASSTTTTVTTTTTTTTMTMTTLRDDREDSFGKCRVGWPVKFILRARTEATEGASHDNRECEQVIVAT